MSSKKNSKNKQLTLFGLVSRDIAYIKRKKEKIEAKSVDYNYLKQLRQAIIDENRRR